MLRRTLTVPFALAALAASGTARALEICPYDATLLARLPELATADETAIRFTPAASRLPRAVGPATPPVHRAVIAVR